MRKPLTGKIILLAALNGALSACSGGGGGGMSQSVTAGTSTTTASTNTGAAVDFGDTGIAGTVTSPAAATFGSASPQLAASGGTSFDGTNGSFPANVTFPLLISSLQKSPTGLSPVSGNQGATVTVVNSSFNSTTVQLTIPSLGVNEALLLHSSLASGGDQFIDGLSYAVMGAWIQRQTTNSPNQLSNSVFVFGYETPQTAMPTSGTAVFSSKGWAVAHIYKPFGGEIRTSTAIGDASISANFGSGAITGSFTKMQTTILPVQTWNDVSLSANIASGTNRFSGTTVASGYLHESVRLGDGEHKRGILRTGGTKSRSSVVPQRWHGVCVGNRSGRSLSILKFIHIHLRTHQEQK
jgi:hypothetical protein